MRAEDYSLQRRDGHESVGGGRERGERGERGQRYGDDVRSRPSPRVHDRGTVIGRRAREHGPRRL